MRSAREAIDPVLPLRLSTAQTKAARHLPRHPGYDHLSPHLLPQNMQHIRPIMHTELGKCLGATHVETVQTC